MAKGKTYWRNKCDKLWKQKVKERAGFRCEVCGCTHKQMHAHHLISRSAIFFRHNLENGMCLCASCHRYEYGQKGKFSAHGSPLLFEEWMEKNRPDTFLWWQKNQHAVTAGVTIDYEQVFHALEAAWH